MTGNENRTTNHVLADMMFFDYLKEKVGERKTKTGAYCDLLEKSTAGFVSPFLKKHEYVLQADQCHVTISDLAVEWHWHRATVRSFLDKLEEMGYIRRTRLAKSVVITAAFAPKDNGESLAPCIGQTESHPADELDMALSEWITGNLSDNDMGDMCDLYYDKRIEPEADPSDIASLVRQATVNLTACKELTQELVERIAVAGLKRAIRNSRFDDPSAFIDFFERKLACEWSSLLAASRMTAKMIVFGEDDVADDGSGEKQTLLTLLKPFKALLAKRLEREPGLL